MKDADGYDAADDNRKCYDVCIAALRRDLLKRRAGRAVIVPYAPEHLAAVQLQPEQVRDTFDESVPEQGDSWALVIDGRSLAVGGLYPVLPNMAIAWAFIGADAGPHFVRMVRAMREKLDASSWPVVRAGALHGFEAAGRLLKMLGFHQINAVTHYRARVYDVFEWCRHEH